MKENKNIRFIGIIAVVVIILYSINCANIRIADIVTIILATIALTFAHLNWRTYGK